MLVALLFPQSALQQRASNLLYHSASGAIAASFVLRAIRLYRAVAGAMPFRETALAYGLTVKVHRTQLGQSFVVDYELSPLVAICAKVEGLGHLITALTNLKTRRNMAIVCYIE